MEGKAIKQILAIITLNDRDVKGGGAPVFLASNKENQNKMAFELAKALKADAYGLINGDILIISK